MGGHGLIGVDEERLEMGRGLVARVVPGVAGGKGGGVRVAVALDGGWLGGVLCCL